VVPTVDARASGSGTGEVGQVAAVHAGLPPLRLPSHYEGADSEPSSSLPTPSDGKPDSRVNSPTPAFQPVPVSAAQHRLAQISHPSPSESSSSSGNLGVHARRSGATNALALGVQQLTGLGEGGAGPALVQGSSTGDAAGKAGLLPLPELPTSSLDSPRTGADVASMSQLGQAGRLQVRLPGLPPLQPPSSPRLTISAAQTPIGGHARFLSQAPVLPRGPSMPGSPRLGSMGGIPLSTATSPLAHVRGRSFRLPLTSSSACSFKHVARQLLANNSAMPSVHSQPSPTSSLISEASLTFQALAGKSSEGALPEPHSNPFTAGLDVSGGTSTDGTGSSLRGFPALIPGPPPLAPRSPPSSLPLAGLSMRSRVALVLAHGLPCFATFEDGTTDEEVARSLAALPDMG